MKQEHSPRVQAHLDKKRMEKEIETRVAKLAELREKPGNYEYTIKYLVATIEKLQETLYGPKTTDEDSCQSTQYPVQRQACG